MAEHLEMLYRLARIRVLGSDHPQSEETQAPAAAQPSLKDDAISHPETAPSLPLSDFPLPRARPRE